MRPGAFDGVIVWRLAVFLYAMLLTSLHMAMATPWRLASFERLVSFQAVEPFQHRLLVPGAVALVQWLLPVGEELLFALCEVAAWAALLVLSRHALTVLRVGGSEPLRSVLAFTVIIPVGLHLLVPNLVVDPPVEIDAGVLELGVLRAQSLFYYVYDLPAAAFTLALVLCILAFRRTRQTRWFVVYMAVFALATVNRETSAFFVLGFAAGLYGVLDRAVLLKALVLQAGVFAVIQGVLQWMFADNVNPNANVSGTAYEIHLFANLGLFLNPLYLLTFLARFCAGLYLPAMVLRGYLDPGLARVLVVVAVPFVALVFCFGRVQEQRVFIELVPLIWLAGLQAIHSWWTRPGTRPAGQPAYRSTERSSPSKPP